MMAPSAPAICPSRMPALGGRSLTVGLVGPCCQATPGAHRPGGAPSARVRHMGAAPRPGHSFSRHHSLVTGAVPSCRPFLSQATMQFEWLKPKPFFTS